jgi:hypothetical protein
MRKKFVISSSDITEIKVPEGKDGKRYTIALVLNFLTAIQGLGDPNFSMNRNRRAVYPKTEDTSWL